MLELAVELLLISLFITANYSIWRFLLRPAFVAEYKAEMQGVINRFLQQTARNGIDKESPAFRYNYRVLQILRDHAHEVTYLNFFFLGLYERKYGTLRPSKNSVFDVGTTEYEKEVAEELGNSFFQAYNRYLNRTTPLIRIVRLPLKGLNKISNGLIRLHNWINKSPEPQNLTEKTRRRAAWNRLRKFSVAFSFSNEYMLKEASQIVQKYQPLHC